MIAPKPQVLFPCWIAATLVLGTATTSTFAQTPLLDVPARVVAPAGDVDGDGVPDLIAGDDEIFGGPGRARLVSGSDGTTLYEWTGMPNPWAHEMFGHSVAGDGDVDGDGVFDILVGAPQLYLGGTPETSSGYVKVFSGADGSELFFLRGRVTSNDWRDAYGYSVAFCGDLDGDGRDEMVIGAPEHNPWDHD